MDVSLYGQIVALRDLTNAPKRGYRFEQALREILPWTSRPPLTASGQSEQFDAFYEWNRRFYLVEAKAKRPIIKQGASEWEDFELKLRRRQGSVVGLFCSLWPVHENVIDAARRMNEGAVPAIVLAGGIWDELTEMPLPFGDVLQYCLYHAHTKHSATPPALKAVQEWCYERSSTEAHVRDVCCKKSGTFLRRYRLPKHSELYVPRALDEYAGALADSLRPSLLRRQVRKHKHGKEIVEVKREAPRQVCVIRDLSGCGKTMFVVNLALQSPKWFCVARAALEPDIDDLYSILHDVGREDGLFHLLSLDRPMFYAVDSLDEAGHIPEKRRESIAILRIIDDLNTKARAVGLLCFPIALVVTVREDYWRHWQSVFEGRPLLTYRKRLSNFTTPEFDDALQQYATTYHYTPTTTPTASARRLLSVPFNLLVFSEAHEYAGTLSFAEVFPENVLHLYFAKKRDDILRRHIPGFVGAQLMHVCAELAVKVAKARANRIAQSAVLQAIGGSFPTLAPLAEEIVLALVSEQILLRDPDNPDELRFRHNRVIEYLIAYHIVATVEERQNTDWLDEEIRDLVESELITIYSIHECIKFMCKSEKPAIYRLFEKYYASSSELMKITLAHLRQDIAYGGFTDPDDLKLIAKHTQSSDPAGCWDCFFVLAARRNSQPPGKIVEAFDFAWTTNPNSVERWRLLHKLWERGLLLNERVFLRITESDSAKEWQVFLGCLLESPDREGLVEMWNEFGGGEVHHKLKAQSGGEWRHVDRLLTILLEGRDYIPGEALW